MGEATWDALGLALEGALAQPDAERAAWLDRHCPAGLREEVQALLAAHPDGPDPLSGGVDPRAGVRVGAWRLVRAIGRGGMGDVYLATRADAQYTGVAAVKIGRAGAGVSDERFLAERQILAALDHPHIARLLDGGVTADGRPYLVMEYVADGLPLRTYCDRRGLALDARIDLVLSLCDAVAHAHSRLVIHRDLKSDNVLVTPDGVPRLLDFGVAKVLDPARVGLAGRDTTALAPVTLGCAAPEQLRGEAVGTMSDVFGLGVLLFELLTGRPPHDLTGLSVAQAVARLCDEPAPLASQVARTPWRDALRPDLDAVLRAALERDPAERYPSVAALAADLRRYRAEEPVLAMPPSVAYRARKFVRRHRGGVAGAAAVALSLALGAGAAVWQARAAALERDRAVAEREAADRVTELVVSLFEGADPTVSGAVPRTALELVERGEPRVLAGLQDDPAARGRLLGVLGQVRRNLGDLRHARELLEEAVAARRAEGGAPRDLARALLALATTEKVLADLPAAERHAREAHGSFAAALGPAHPDTLGAEAELANVLSLDPTRVAAAAATYERLLAASEEPGVSRAASFGLGEVRLAQGRAREAAELFGRAARWAERAGDDDQRADALDAQCVALQEAGEAVASYLPQAEEVLALRRRRLGAHNPVLATTVGNVGSALYGVGDLEGAIERFREAVELSRAAYGDHDLTALALSNLAVALVDAARLPEAESALREALALRVALHGAQAQPNARLHANLAKVLLLEGALDEADAQIDHALGNLLPDASPDDVARYTATRGAIALARGDLVRARGELEAALELFDRQLPEGSRHSGEALLDAARLDLAAGDPAGALSRARRALAVFERVCPDNWRAADALRLVGELEVATGRRDEGVRHVREASERLTASLGGEHPTARVAARSLQRLAPD